MVIGITSFSILAAGSPSRLPKRLYSCRSPRIPRNLSRSAKRTVALCSLGLRYVAGVWAPKMCGFKNCKPQP